MTPGGTDQKCRRENIEMTTEAFFICGRKKIVWGQLSGEAQKLKNTMGKEGVSKNTKKKRRSPKGDGGRNSLENMPNSKEKDQQESREGKGQEKQREKNKKEAAYHGNESCDARQVTVVGRIKRAAKRIDDLGKGFRFASSRNSQKRLRHQRRFDWGMPLLKRLGGEQHRTKRDWCKIR